MLTNAILTTTTLRHLDSRLAPADVAHRRSDGCICNDNHKRGQLATGPSTPASNTEHEPAHHAKWPDATEHPTLSSQTSRNHHGDTP